MNMIVVINDALQSHGSPLEHRRISLFRRRVIPRQIDLNRGFLTPYLLRIWRNFVFGVILVVDFEFRNIRSMRPMVMELQLLQISQILKNDFLRKSISREPEELQGRVKKHSKAHLPFLKFGLHIFWYHCLERS